MLAICHLVPDTGSVSCARAPCFPAAGMLGLQAQSLMQDLTILNKCNE